MSNWVIRPKPVKQLVSQVPIKGFGTCRFCLSSGEHLNMMTEHLLDGKQENYSDMLLECFNIFICSDDTSSSLICSECAARLSDARNFRRLVMRVVVKLEPAGSNSPINALTNKVTVKSEPEEPKESEESIEPEESKEPEISNELTEIEEPRVKIEPDDIKTEIDIEEHGPMRTGVNSCKRKGFQCPDDELDQISDNDLESKKQRLEGYITNSLDSVLAGIKSEVNTEHKKHNIYGCHPESVEKFLKEYYSGIHHESDDEDEESLIVITNGQPSENRSENMDHSQIMCGCAQKCMSKFCQSDILNSRLDCQELDFNCNHHINHLNLLTLGALNCIGNINQETLHKATRQRNHVNFLFRGVPVCRQFFLFTHSLGVKKFKNILKCFKENGVKPKAHSSAKQTLPSEQKKDVVKFINSFSEQNSLILPGRRNGANLHILPVSVSRASVYIRYVNACKITEKQPVTLGLWNICWDTFCSNITIPTLISETCDTCDHSMAQWGKSESEDTKMKCLIEAMEHLNQVQTQRMYYQDVIAQVSRQAFLDNLSIGHHAPCSYDGLLHYSFDYFQEIDLPNSPDTSVDFLDNFKVSLFGVAIEPLQKFVMYLIPECISKSTDVLISLLHHFFDNFGLGETEVVCHTTNCPNQNKNNSVIQYATWRVMGGLHKSFQLSYLPSGHSKFAPDVYFGMFKSKFRESNANSLNDLREIASADNDVTAVIVANESGQFKQVNTYDWKRFFGDHNPTKIPELPTYLHFKTNSKESSGAIKCSKSSPFEFSEDIKVFEAPFDDMPDVVKPQRLSLERQKYLYANVRSFVSPECRDIICPFPKGPVPA